MKRIKSGISQHNTSKPRILQTKNVQRTPSESKTPQPKDRTSLQRGQKTTTETQHPEELHSSTDRKQ